MDTQLTELRDKLQHERQQLVERLNEIDTQLASVKTVIDLLKTKTSQSDKSQLSFLNIAPVSEKLRGLTFKDAVNTILKENPPKWWKPKDLFETLLKEGFETNSKNFNNVARNMLMQMRKRGEVDLARTDRGYMYKYKEKGSVPHMDETESDRKEENGVRMIRFRPTTEKKEEPSSHELEDI